MGHPLGEPGEVHDIELDQQHMIDRGIEPYDREPWSQVDEPAEDNGLATIFEEDETGGEEDVSMGGGQPGFEVDVVGGEQALQANDVTTTAQLQVDNSTTESHANFDMPADGPPAGQPSNSGTPEAHVDGVPAGQPSADSEKPTPHFGEEVEPAPQCDCCVPDSPSNEDDDAAKMDFYDDRL